MKQLLHLLHLFCGPCFFSVMKDLRKKVLHLARTTKDKDHNGHLLEGDLPSKKYVSNWVLNS